MRRRLLSLCLLGLLVTCAMAQRMTDNLDRGLVAVKTNSGVFCSWRILGSEYYDVCYNIYRDGTKINSVPLNVSNFTDKGGTATSTYTVEPVVRGKAQAVSAAAKTWAKNYLEVKMNHGTLTSNYIPNDACVADVDGDGELEILLKFDNRSDGENGYMPGGYNGEYAIIEVYKLDGTRLWWIDLGPNMGDFQNNENNIVAYDWDGDGKAEAVLRAADGTVIHMADGTTQVIGDKSKNYRPSGGNSGQWFIHEGSEYLLYLNGETGKPYQVKDYPLKRLEAGETDLNAAWGDGYGHRSTKHFFGAPVLDGRHASLFLARGIYTRHKMIAYDIDASTHELVERWRWNCNDSGSGWYGQGYHNFGIADVDWDGRDEIVFGSMVIDDNGKGLSTTGLGHGDAQHCSDFDPYTHGQEIFACNESRPGNNFRDATTSKIYYRYGAGNDDGRANMGNFVDDVPGAQGVSSRDPNLVGSVSHAAVNGLTKGDVHITQNFRIYWDGDLCEESFDYKSGKNTEGHIVKARTGEIAVLEGSMTNNDTKGTPSYQGDVLGDWREEVIMRTSDGNIRIYTTDMETPWRNYTLWHDHQYRQAMVWQMCGYNQPPHPSYFLGEYEGITAAPPALTMTGRTEVANGSTISPAADDTHIIMCETGDMTVSVADGAKPYIFTDNAPTWVQGHDDNDNITTETYTHTLTGGAFAGGMRLVKQGDGVLVLPAVTQTYTGNTEVWAGTLCFDGTMQSSRVWLNRHSRLVSSGKFMKTIQAEYGATLVPGGENAKGGIECDSLKLNFGSRVLIDLFSDGILADVIKAAVLNIEKKDWDNGPQYSAPVLQFVSHPADGADRIAEGKYLIGEVGQVSGNLSDFVLEGLNSQKAALSLEDGKLYISIENYASGNVTWTGSEGSTWDVDNTRNFTAENTGETRSFVQGDAVTFDDNSAVAAIVVHGNVAPASVVFNNEKKNFVLSGDSIVGSPTVTKNGAGEVSIYSVNRTGNTTVNGGKLIVSTLANSTGQDYGSLGGIDKTITVNNNATLGVSRTLTNEQTIVVGEGGATVDVASGATMNMSVGFGGTSASSVLTKGGLGELKLGASNKIARLVIMSGTVSAVESDGATQLPAVVEFRSGTLYDPNGENSYTTNNASFVVPEGCTGTFYADPRCGYNGKLTGSGTFNVYAAGVRNYFQGDWSGFEGTLVPGLSKRGSYDPSFDFTNTKGLPKATMMLNSGMTFNNGGRNISIGRITGTGTLAGTGTYTIGASDADISFNGQIESPVVKTGAGTWSLSNSAVQSNIGLVRVNGGCLYLNTYNSTTSVLDNTVLLDDGGSMKGAGTVKAITINSGGELTPGRTTTTDVSGFIATTGAFRANAGAIVNLNIKTNANTNAARSFLKVGGDLTFNGTLCVTLSPSYAPAIGDEIVLWTADAFSGTPTLTLPELPAGLMWNTDGLLAATGKLRVVDDASGIIAGNADEAVHCRIYTVSGVMVTEFDATVGTAVGSAAKVVPAGGTYVVRMNTRTAASTVKISVNK